MNSIFRTSDVLLAAFLMAVVALLVVPLPTAALDILLVLNLAFSLLLLLAGLFVPNAVALLSFPSILLLLTLFRLSLNVASTRLILTQGDAGQVIQSFGTFLIRGEIVVGLIIFLILTVVNFIVVARGAARVSEVAARFALDALPGRQSAIDADLRAGLLSTAEAQVRREDLRKESQLYGSMDGAMKFVQGDAVAGLFIIATNIFGGIYLGVRGGLSIEDALSTYTTLTVGDGLVHQIPAILVSICAGMVVTRVGSSEHASLGSDVGAQIFTRPGLLAFCALLLLALGATPGLPFVPFAAVSLVFLFGAYVQRRRRGGEEWPLSWQQPMLTRPGQRLLPDGRRPIGKERGGEGVVRIFLDARFLYHTYSENPAAYQTFWERVRDDAIEARGVSLPYVSVEPDEAMRPGEYSLRAGGAELKSGSVPIDALLVVTSPQSLELLGVEAVGEAEHPGYGQNLVWVQAQSSVEKIAEAAQIEVLDPIEFIMWECGFTLLAAPDEVLSLTAVMELEADLEKHSPGILAQSVDRSFLTPARLTQVLRELVREGISIRDFRQVVEYMASYCGTDGAALVREGEFDIDDIVEFVRAQRRRQRITELLSPRRSLKVISLTAETQEILEGIRSGSARTAQPLSAVHSESLRMGLDEVMVPLLRCGGSVAAILAPDELRVAVGRTLRAIGYRIGVISEEDIDAGILVEPVGQWRAVSR